MSDTETDYQFYHKLYDTLTLLGAPKPIADLMHKAKDGVTQEMVDRIANYNIELFTATKMKLANLNSMKITIAPKDDND